MTGTARATCSTTHPRCRARQRVNSHSGDRNAVVVCRKAPPAAQANVAAAVQAGDLVRTARCASQPISVANSPSKAYDRATVLKYSVLTLHAYTAVAASAGSARRPNERASG